MVHDSRIRVAFAGWEFESWGVATLAPCIVQTSEISAPQKYTCGTATRKWVASIGRGLVPSSLRGGHTCALARCGR